MKSLGLGVGTSLKRADRRAARARNLSLSISIMNSGGVSGGAPPPSFTPAFQFNDARNTQYIPIIS